MQLRYFPAARADIKNVLTWSVANFGHAAARRYKHLLAVAIADIAANPELDHSKTLRGLQSGVRIYHLKHSRIQAVLDGKIVKQPRHFIVYKYSKSHIVIVRVLHERMEIPGQVEATL